MKLMFFIILVFLLFTGVSGQDVRPIKDDVGYCWTPGQIEHFMEFLQAGNLAKPGKSSAYIAGISPHDDYLYAGKVYYPLFKSIQAPEVVIFGVTHGTVRRKYDDPQQKLILDSHAMWQGPYGKINVSGLREYIKENLDSRHYMVHNGAHQLEHSIEGMLPFLQYIKRNVRIVPIMVTAMPFETMKEISGKLAVVIADYMREKKLEAGKDIFFLISADANHYGEDFKNTPFGTDYTAHRKAVAHDRQLIDNYLNGTVDAAKLKGLAAGLWGKDYSSYGDTVWCGQYSIPFGLLTVQHVIEKRWPGKKLVGELLTYSDTYTDGVLPVKNTGMGITAPFSVKHWVGYFSAGFYLK